MATTKTKRVTAYFSSWVVLALICIVLNILNVNWDDGEQTCFFVIRPSSNNPTGNTTDNSGNNTQNVFSNFSTTTLDPSNYSVSTSLENVLTSTQTSVSTTDSSWNNTQNFNVSTSTQDPSNYSVSSAAENVLNSTQIPLNSTQDSANDTGYEYEQVCTKVPKTHIAQGIFIVIFLAVLQGSVLEFPVQTVATLILGGDKRATKTADASGITIVLNYNILATSKDDIDECLTTMHEAYMGNLAEHVSAVLVSATNEDNLKQYELQVRDKYRALIYDTLFREGLNFAAGDLGSVDPLRLEKVWSRYGHVDRDVFARDYLDGVCDEFAREFMVIHRVSRVLRKCGQYQDLMLLSTGDTEAYTYTDPAYYGRQARPFGQPLFHSSPDVDNIVNRHFDYTLVLDGDTGVVKGSVFELLKVAAAHPERGIIQPAIKLHCSNEDTLFMNLEMMRQEMYEPMTNAMMALFGQSSYFGKALLKNSVYIQNVIGTRDHLIERVPVDVLSHDTFEAALLKPLYCSTVHLLEAPSYNYVSWNIRERRWNRGEVLLATYFWKHGVGVPMRWLQSKIQGDKFNATKLRTESKLDFVTSYIAHSALRQMMMKPLLLVYIVCNYKSFFLYRWASIIIIMFLVLVFPKLATCNRNNYRFVLLETVASIFQFTPDSLVGCVRIVRAIHANLVVQAKWVPQRAVEEQFKQSNPFVSSLQHLWGYSVVAVIVGVLVGVFVPDGLLILVMVFTLFVLPLYTGITSLSKGLRSSRTIAERRGMVVNATIPTVARPDLKSQYTGGGKGTVPAFTNLGFVSEGDKRDSPSNSRLRFEMPPSGYLHIPRPRLYPRLELHAAALEGILTDDSRSAGSASPLIRTRKHAQVTPPTQPTSQPNPTMQPYIHPTSQPFTHPTSQPSTLSSNQFSGLYPPQSDLHIVPLHPASLSPYPPRRLQPSAPPLSRTGVLRATPDLSRERSTAIPTAFSSASFQPTPFYLNPTAASAASFTST